MVDQISVSSDWMDTNYICIQSELLSGERET